MEDSTSNEQDETRRRFQEILAAKKNGSKGSGTSVPGREDRAATRQSPAKGGRNYRRKV